MLDKTLVLCLGNSIVGDDGVAFKVAEILEKKIGNKLKIVRTEEFGLRLLDYITGYENLIVVDAFIKNDKGDCLPVVLDLNPEGKPELRGGHFMNLQDVLKLAKVLGLKVPQKIKLFGIPINRTLEIKEGLSEEALKSARITAQVILRELNYA